MSVFNGMTTNKTMRLYNPCIVLLMRPFTINVLFLDEIKKLLEFLPTGKYSNIFNGTFARCILGFDIDYKTGELLGCLLTDSCNCT